MPQADRFPMLEVSVEAVGPTSWEWSVRDSVDLVMSGFEASRSDAQTEGDTALFSLLASGWYRAPT
jgi:hypothetical protein